MNFMKTSLLLLACLAFYPSDAHPIFQFPMTSDRNEIDEKHFLRTMKYENNHKKKERKRKLKGMTESLTFENTARALKDGNVFIDPKAEEAKKEDKQNKDKEKEPKQKDPKMDSPHKTNETVVPKKDKEKELEQKDPKMESSPHKAVHKTNETVVPVLCSKGDIGNKTNATILCSSSLAPSMSPSPVPNSTILVNSISTMPPTPSKPEIDEQTDNDEMITATCPETNVANGDSQPNDKDVTITYQYSLETTTNDLDPIESKLKSHMFEKLVNHLCSSTRRISVIADFQRRHTGTIQAVDSDVRSHHRRLELTELKTTARDENSGSCELKQNTNNTCTVYKGEIVATINDEGGNSNLQETRNNIISYLNYYAENENLKSIDESIVMLKIFNVEQGSQLSEINEENEGHRHGGAVTGVATVISVVAAVVCHTFIC